MKKVIALIFMVFVITSISNARGADEIVTKIEDMSIDDADKFFTQPITSKFEYDFPFEYVDYKEGVNEVSHVVFDEDFVGQKVTKVFKQSPTTDVLCEITGFSKTKNLKGIEEMDINIPVGYSIPPGKHKIELWGKDTTKQLYYNAISSKPTVGYLIKVGDEWLPSNGVTEGDLNFTALKFLNNTARGYIYKTPEKIEVNPTTMFTGGGGILAPVAGQTFKKEDVIGYIYVRVDPIYETVGLMATEELILIKFVE